MASHTEPDYRLMEGSLIGLGYGKEATMGNSGEKWCEVENGGGISHVSSTQSISECVSELNKPSHIVNGPNETLNKATDEMVYTWKYWGIAFLLTFTPLVPVALVMYLIGLFYFVSSMFHWIAAPFDKKR